MSDQWDEFAACRGQYTEEFYPDNNVVLDVTKLVCAGCPVRTACLVASIPERYGFWAGLTMTDRDRLRSKIGYSIAPSDGDVAAFRAAAQEGFRTGDYAGALASVIGTVKARKVEEVTVDSRLTA